MASKPQDTPSVLGTDIFLSSSLDALWRPSGGDMTVDAAGDLAVITSEDNLQQALVNRIISELGELDLHPTYGLDVRSAIGKKHIEERRVQLKIRILQALKLEPRIKEIMRLEVQQDTEDPRICRVEIDATAITEEDSLRLNLVWDLYGSTFIFKP